MSVGWFWRKQLEKFIPFLIISSLKIWSSNCESIKTRSDIHIYNIYIHVFFVETYFEHSPRKNFLMMVSSSLFFSDSFLLYRGPFVGKQFSSRWPAELHLLLVLFGGGGMVEWYLDLTHSSGSENKRMRANIRIFVFFFFWKKKRLFSTSNGLFKFTSWRSEKFVFVWDEGFWMDWMESCWIFHPFSSRKLGMWHCGTWSHLWCFTQGRFFATFCHVLRLLNHYFIFSFQVCILEDTPKTIYWHLATIGKIQWFPSQVTKKKDYPSSHGSVENGCISFYSFLSFGGPIFHWTISMGERVHSLKLTCPLKYTIPKGEKHLPSINFQGRAVSFGESKDYQRPYSKHFHTLLPGLQIFISLVVSPIPKVRNPPTRESRRSHQVGDVCQKRSSLVLFLLVKIQSPLSFVGFGFYQCFVGGFWVVYILALRQMSLLSYLTYCCFWPSYLLNR